MHKDDSGRVEQGDWTLGMKPKPDKFPLLFRMVSLVVQPGPSIRSPRTSSWMTGRL